MHPILFEIAGFPVFTYGVLLAAAYLLGLQFAIVRGRQRGLDPNRTMDLGIWIIISALVGAKLLLLATERRGRPFPGRTFWGYMLLYGISRFIIEFYRGDSRGAIGMLSTSQFVSVLIVPLSVVMLIVLARRPDPSRKVAAARRAA